jgi:putative endonuclease
VGVSGRVEGGGEVNTKALGELGERIAESFLRLKSFEIVRRNYVYAGREIDLLARKGPFLVGVEVKLRRGGRFGSAIEAIDKRKLSRIQLALSGALSVSEKPLVPRVDVIVIDLDGSLDRMVVQHIENVY